MKSHGIALLGLLLAATAAYSQTEIKLPLVSDAAIQRLVRVTAPSACCAAVSDAHGWLAIGHQTSYNDAQVSLFRLDRDGTLAAGEPIPLKLASPTALASFPNYPLSLAFHPKLPLLYVWQDVALPKRLQEDEPALQEFDHLHIYSLAGPEPVLVQSQARGSVFADGMSAGTIAVDADSERLYLPNVRQPGAKPHSMYGTCAYLELDGDGLPLPADRGAKVAPPPRVGASLELHCLNPKNSPVNLGLPQGMGIVPVSKDMAILGIGSGAMTWDAANRRGWSDAVMLHPLWRGGFHDRIAAHPTLPVVYSTLMNRNLLCAMQHADGYLTLMPRRVAVEGAAFKSYPLVLKSRNELAVGGAKLLYLISLDEQGFPQPTAKAAKINSRSVAAIAYSEKFDCLYVAEERTK